MELNVSLAQAKLLCESKGLEVSAPNAKEVAGEVLHDYLTQYLRRKKIEEQTAPSVEPIT